MQGKNDVALRPGEEFYLEGKAKEKAGDLASAIALYKKAERLGHPLSEPELDRKDGYCPPSYPVPKDDEGFIKSFALHQEQEIKEFYERYGFVVIRDVLTPEECKATIDEMWDYIKHKGYLGPKDALSEKEKETPKSQIDRNKPWTWNNSDWPPGQKEGILGGRVVFWPQALRNRQNPQIYKAFTMLLGKEDLNVNHDRYSLFRPTKDVPFIIDEEKEFLENETPPEKCKVLKDKPDWKTTRNLHIDMNPWKFVKADSSTEGQSSLVGNIRYECEADFTENNEIANDRLNIQGSVNLLDNREEDGGFILVPGFKHHFLEWTESTRNDLRLCYSEEDAVTLPEEEPLQMLAIRVTARAGSLVLWDQRTPHGSAPNDSSRWRAAQFLKMFPAIDPSSERGKARAAALKKKIDDENNKEGRKSDEGSMMTELGAKLLGFSSWNS